MRQHEKTKAILSDEFRMIYSNKQKTGPNKAAVMLIGTNSCTYTLKMETEMDPKHRETPNMDISEK